MDSDEYLITGITPKNDGVEVYFWNLSGPKVEKLVVGAGRFLYRLAGSNRFLRKQVIRRFAVRRRQNQCPSRRYRGKSLDFSQRMRADET